jgi:hypothetical protein
MPDKILSKDQLAQLDGNIRKMVGDGLGREDIDAYARDFKERFGKSDGSSVDSVPATSAITIVQPGAPVSKYQKAVNDDRSEIGKFASKWYNNIVSSFERIGGAVADLPAQFNIAAPGFAPTEIGKAQEQAKAFTQQPLAKRLEPAKELKQKIGKAADVVRSGYTTREEERATAGQFNIMDGIGLSDIEALASMSGGMAVDMGLGAMTGSGTFLLQGYNDAVEDYDAATQKAGLEPSEGARGLYGIAGGVINGLLEKFAVDKLVGDTPVFKDIQKKAIANVLKNTAGMTGKKAVDAIETAAVAEIKKLTSDIKSRGVRAAYRTAVEGGTEAVQAALEDGAKLAANLVQGNEAFNEDEIRKGFIQNIVNSGVAGGIMGPIFGAGADKAFGRNVNTQVLKDISEANTPEQLAAINDELAATFDENNFTQEERDAVMANANRYAQIKQTLPAGTNSIAQTIAIPLIENRIKIDNEIQTRRNAMESVDEALKADEESAIALLEDKRAQINDDIREVVNNEKFDYYEDNGKFYKKLGENAPEEISKNRFDLQQLKTEGYATTTGQGPIQEGGTTGDIGQRQGTQEGGTQETPPQTDTSYRYIVSEEGSEFPVRALVNKKVRKDGRPAILYQEGQRIVARILGTNRIEDVGNVVEMMDALPQDFGIEVDETVVTETPTGYRVEGEDMVNDSENPLDAISMDQNGNVMNVVLKTPAGKRRKFRGQAAKDLAYQITLKETLKNEDEFELFLEQEHQAELDAAEAKAAAEAATNAANEPVPTTEEPTTTEPVTGPTTEPTTGPTVTTKPTYGTVTVDNIDRIDKLKGYDRLQRKVLKDVKNVVLAIRFILQSQGKEVAVNLHSQESFENAVIEAGGSKEDSTSRGFYMTDDGSIHLNMENLASDTMLHEGFHPILDFLEANDPKVINDFFAQLEAIPGSEDIIAQARENYDGDVTQKKEAITDFVAGVADGRIVLNPSNFRKIRKFLLDMLNKIGIGKGGGTIMEVKDPKGLIELAKLVTEDFTEGFAIYKYELLDIISGDKKYDSSDGVDIDETLPEEGTDRGPQFSKSTIEAARKNIKSIASLIGTKISRVVFYDLTRVGPLDIKNIKSGYTPKVEGKGGPFYSYMEQRSNDKAVLAFVSLTQAIQSLNRQILYPNGVHAITSQNPQTGHLGNKSTLAALFGEGIGIFQNAATTQEEETEIVNTLVGEIDRLSKVKVEPGKKEPEVVANVKKILKVVDLASIKTIDDFRDKILLGEGDSFGSRGSILDEILQEKQTKVTKSTRGSHTILHYKYGIPTKADIAEGNNQKELSSAELGDVIKLVRPSTDRVIYTTSKAEFDLYSKNPSDGMVEAGIRIELLPESSVHESYPFILAGENVALLENYISVAQLYEEFKDVKKSLSFFKLGRMKKDAAAGEIPKTVTKEEGAPKFQSQKAVNKDIQQRTNAASEKLKQLFNRGNIPLNISEAKQIVNEVIDWSSWYDGISDYVNDIFGEYSEDVLSLLPLASQGNGSAGTVALAINNIERIYKGEKPVGLAEYKGYVSDFLGGKGIESDKMYNFFKALTGDKDAIAVDMHVWSIIMGKNPNKKQVNPKNQAQFNRAKEFVNLLSKELGLAPREVQASLWAANILRTGGKPDSYEEYIARQVEKNGLKERIEGWRDKGYKPFSEVRKAREAVRAEGKEPQFQRVAPNGKPSNLNPSQYEQVRTPAFKKWFGDWENDPANASKVVDDNGEPLVVYHGTNVKENFDTFKGTDYIFFAKDADFASEYARAMNGRVVPAFVNAKKIFDPTEMTQSEEDDIFDIIEKEELNRGANEDRAYDIAYQTIKRLTNKVDDNWLIAESDQVNKYIKSKGYDALAVRETGSENIAVIDPNQIKSATANVGTFSTEDNRIQFQKAPTKPITKGKLGGTKKFYKEQVRYGLLGKESVRLKEKMSGELSAELATAETRVKETMKTIKKYGGAVTEKDISDFMEGKPSANQLPLDLATQLTEMRAQIDGLTERLIQLGVIDSQESIDYYRENKGKYLLRSYEAINFKENPLMANFQGKGLNIDNVAKKLKNVDQTVVDTALKYLSDRAKAANPTLTDAEAMKIARADANEILSDSEDYVMNKGMTGSTNVKSLRQRKDISPEIRALMGEYTDPLYNYYATIFKISSLTSSRQYLNSLKEFGMGKFFFTEKTEDATVKFAGDESDALAPLNGIYTFPEIKEALKVADNETTWLITKLAGRVRMLKTVYNPATHVKNIIGNMGFAVSNGHWQNIPEAYKYIRGAITGKTDQDIMKMMDTLNRYGVLNNVIGVGELKAYFDKNESVDDFLKSVYNNANNNTTASKLGKAKANLAKIPKAIEKAYAIEDDVFKILAFVNESNRYSKALFDKNYNKLSDDQKKEIDGIASEIVKDTYPTFSRVPKGVRTLSKVAFIGNFLAFPVESVRTQYNSLSLGVKEMKSGNKKLQSVGKLRLGGALAYNSLFASLSMYAYNLAGAGITGAVGMLFGDDEEENETSNSIKKNLAPWNKNSDVYVSKFKDGMLEYYDIGSLDSYGYQRRVWNAFWSTKNKGEFDQMMASGVGELLTPWITKDFVVDNYMKLTNNDNGRGGTIYNPEGKAADKYKDMALFVGKQFGPGAVGSAIKVAEAYQKGEYEKVMDELGAQVFARRYSVDLNKQFQNYIYTEGTDPKKEVGFKYRLQNAEKIYRDAKRQKLSPAKLSEKYGEALEAYKEILLTANEYYKAAALGGTNPKLLIESLKKSRIGRAEAMAIITGSFGKYDQAYIRK